MGAINSIKKSKSAMGPMNNSKNKLNSKLNSEIIYNFHWFPNSHIVERKTHGIYLIFKMCLINLFGRCF